MRICKLISANYSSIWIQGLALLYVMTLRRVWCSVLQYITDTALLYIIVLQYSAVFHTDYSYSTYILQYSKVLFTVHYTILKLSVIFAFQTDVLYRFHPIPTNSLVQCKKSMQHDTKSTSKRLRSMEKSIRHSASSATFCFASRLTSSTVTR